MSRVRWHFWHALDLAITLPITGAWIVVDRIGRAVDRALEPLLDWPDDTVHDDLAAPATEPIPGTTLRRYVEPTPKGEH